MKKRNNNIVQLIFQIIPILTGVGIAILSGVIYKNNQDLQSQIKKRDQLIKEVRYSDSLFSLQNKKNAEIITKYISECNIVIDGKQLSTEELITYIRKLYTENYNLQLELDSTRTYKSIYELIERRYGIRYILRKEGNSSFLTIPKSKVDTALMLYPYFKDRIRLDSISGKTLIRVN
jgi:hypothetical protein